MKQSIRVLVSDSLAPEGLELLAAQAQVVQGPADQQDLSTFDALVVRSRTRVDAALLERGRPRLRVVGRAGVGVDNIDLQAAKRLGVVVVNAPQAATISVAEHAIGLMLALARRIPQAAQSTRQGQWRKADFVGTELHGKTLGVIGLGRIGSALAQRAQAFGMHVMACDACLEPAEIRQRGAQPAELDAMLPQVDFLSLHVPLTPQTKGLLGERALARMKRGAYLICTARGGVVDEQALLAALDSGHLAGAALDVFATEPPVGSPLLQHPAVVATPHIGAQTREAQVRAGRDIATEVLAALHGQELRWRVV